MKGEVIHCDRCKSIVFDYGGELTLYVERLPKNSWDFCVNCLDDFQRFLENRYER